MGFSPLMVQPCEDTQPAVRAARPYRGACTMADLSGTLPRAVAAQHGPTLAHLVRKRFRSAGSVRSGKRTRSCCAGGWSAA
jgi:hypothetical protein